MAMEELVAPKDGECLLSFVVHLGLRFSVPHCPCSLRRCWLPGLQPAGHILALPGVAASPHPLRPNAHVAPAGGDWTFTCNPDNKGDVRCLPAGCPAHALLLLLPLVTPHQPARQPARLPAASDPPPRCPPPILTLTPAALVRLQHPRPLPAGHDNQDHLQRVRRPALSAVGSCSSGARRQRRRRRSRPPAAGRRSAARGEQGRQLLAGACTAPGAQPAQCACRQRCLMLFTVCLPATCI